ncbi:unnamed protein product [Cuscuta campestris]|uniref:HMA domain-containing protein n=1 Tax=Cuscuta campestris TaxID=132261 RepID=A0A484N909_9ASTE|nr:unnamed protein product [Cuscuta campestris]
MKEEAKKEVVAEKKNEGGEPKGGAAAAGKEEEPAAAAVVLKLDLHCEGCAKKVRRSIRHLDGVKDVKAEWETGKVTVKGDVDPVMLRHTVASKTKKQVSLLSPLPKNDDGNATAAGADKKPDEKIEEKKPKEEAKATMVVMKIRLHCDGCAHKIKKIIKSTKGVQNVTADTQKDLVTVNGTMDVAELTSYLSKKLKRRVEVVPPAKTDGGEEKKAPEGGKKEKEAPGGGGEGEKKKDGEKTPDGGGEGEAKAEVNKMAYGGYHPNTHYYMTPPMYNQSFHNQDYGVMMHDAQFDGYGFNHAPPYSRVAPPPPPPTYINAPPEHVFSEEDPNSCFVM